MRVALLVWTARGGAFGNLSQALAKGLRASGVEEVLLAYLAEGPAEDPGPGIRPVALGTRRARSAVPSIRRFLRRETPDFLISMLPLVSIPAVIAWLLPPRPSTRLVIFHSDTLSSDYRIDHRWDPRMRAVPTAARLLYPRASGLVAETDALRDLLAMEGIDMGSRPLAIIPPPVDVEAIREKARVPASHRWLAEKRTPVVTTLGRLVRRKNVSLLVDAVARLRSEMMDVRLVVLGDGPEKDAIGRAAGGAAGSWLSLAGHVANPFAEIARSDVFVMPSLDEAFCLALAEAMSCGVPVVSTDAAGGGPRFILDGGRHGTLVPSGDEAALSAAVGALLRSPTLRAERAKLSRARSDEFEPRRIAGRWISFLEGLR